MTPRCLAVLLIFTALPASASCSKPLRLVIDYDHMLPFEQADLRWLKGVMQEAGCELQVLPDDSASTGRRLREIEEGNTDLLMNASKLADRTRYAWFTVPYSEEVPQLYARKGEAVRWSQQADLEVLASQGARIAGPPTGWYGDSFEAFRRNHRKQASYVPYIYNVNSGIELLLRKRADLLVTSNRQMLGAEESARAALELLPQKLGGAPVHIMLSKASVSEADFRVVDSAISAALQRGERP